MAPHLHLADSQMRRSPASPPRGHAELILEDAMMNRPLFKVLCLSFLAGSAPSLVRADEAPTSSPATVAPTTPMSVTIPPTAGAVVIEASTNLVDWLDVTMLFPDSGSGLFIDTQSTNHAYRFYRMRTIVSAANNLVTVGALADLRALSAVSGNADVTVRGYYAAGDGGGGQFYWDANSTDADDRGVTIVPASNPSTGRWKRTVQSELNVKWFGAVGDGVVVDTPAIQAALDYVQNHGGGKVFIPAGRYFLDQNITRTLRVGNNTQLEGAGPGTVLISFGSHAIRNLNSLSAPYGNRNITIQNLTIHCSKSGGDGVVFFSVTDSTINNVWIIDPIGYGVWLFRAGDSSAGEGKPTTRVVVSHCHITGVVDVGIECSGAVGCSVVGNTVTGTRGIAGYYAWNGATDCTFTGNVAEGEGQTNSFIGYQVQPADLTTCPVTAAKQTQTQRISFVGNIGRNVSAGFRMAGTEPNKPTDVLVQGNSFSGLGALDRGLDIQQATRVTVQGNTFDGFAEAMLLNDVRRGSSYNGATYVFIENNTIKGGGPSLLFGNSGGSLRGNKFFGQLDNAVSVYSWRNCAISDNMFVNLGKDQDAVGIAVCGYNQIPCTGNIFTGNRCSDDRDVMWTNGTITFSSDAHDSNVVTGNSASGGKPGARAFSSKASGANNIVANNIDG